MLDVLNVLVAFVAEHRGAASWTAE